LNRRRDRINFTVRKILGEIISTDLSDPRLSSVISVTEVSISPDLANASVYISVFLNEQKSDDVLKALRAASGRMQKLLSERVRIRRIPKLTFFIDSHIGDGLRMDTLISDAIASDNK